MDLPNVEKWNAGTMLDEELLNELAYAQRMLFDPAEVHITQTIPQSIPNGTTTGTLIDFDYVLKSNDDMLGDPDGPWDFVTVQTSGWYEASFGVVWAAKADTTLRGHFLILNGATAQTSGIGYADHVNDSTVVGNTPQTWYNYDLFLNAGDTISLGVIQSSGSALSTGSEFAQPLSQTFLHLRWASL